MRSKPFRPEGMAQRILGMGECWHTLTKLSDTLSEERSPQAAREDAAREFDLNDFRDQMKDDPLDGSDEELLENLRAGLQA